MDKMKKLKEGKASGLDGIENKTIKEFAGLLKKNLKKIFNLIFDEQEIPDQ